MTIFTHVRAFEGIFAVIQRNAIRSWKLLGDGVEILVFGDEAGAGEAAAELGVRVLSGVDRTPEGAPRLDSLFRKASAEASSDLLTYVNADIILFPGFLESVRVAFASNQRLLMAGRRQDLDVTSLLDFDANWEKDLVNRADREGCWYSGLGSDYFAFPRGLFNQIPPFALGQIAWDNWLIYEARRRGIAVADATRAIRCIHQSHPGASATPERRNSAGGSRNRDMRRLALGFDYVFTLNDATHQLTSSGLARHWRNLPRAMLWWFGFRRPFRLALPSIYRLYERAWLQTRARR